MMADAALPLLQHYYFRCAMMARADTTGMRDKNALMKQAATLVGAIASLMMSCWAKVAPAFWSLS